MKRYDLHNATLAVMAHRTDGTCPSCQAENQETIYQLFWQNHIMIGCPECVPAETLARITALDFDPAQLPEGRARE